MTVKHTPGPWRIIATVPKAHPDGKPIVLIGADNSGEWGMNALSDEYAVAIIPMVHNESKANARLIWTAPDLLEALEDIERLAVMSTDKEAPYALNAIFHIATSAIAKATQEQ